MKTKMLTSIIEDRVSRELLESGDCIVAGVSGGADSMLLLTLLLELRTRLALEIHVLHINHCIRGSEADSDEEFVRAYCEQRSVSFEAVRIDVPARARVSGRSEEEEGRAARYEAFIEAAGRFKANKIALAHHRDDLAETVLINLFRGTGLSGLKGIPASRRLSEVTIIRPLLSMTKAEIVGMLRANGIAWVEDGTNYDNRYVRNRIRNELMPFAVREINENAAGNIARCAVQVAEAEDFLDSITDDTFGKLRDEGAIVADQVSKEACVRITIDRAELLKLHPYLAKRILMLVLENVGGSLKDIGDVHVSALFGLLDAPTGRCIDLPYGVRARSSYEKLVVEKACVSDFGGTISVETLDFEKIGEERNGASIRELIPKDHMIQWFDPECLPEDVIVRTRLEGDYVLIRMPDGSFGKKSVKSLMIDAKVDSKLRDVMPILAAKKCGETEPPAQEDTGFTSGHLVLWVPGIRRSDIGFVCETTKSVLKACFDEKTD